MSIREFIGWLGTWLITVLLFLLSSSVWAAGTALTSTSIQYLYSRGSFEVPWTKNNQTRIWWNEYTLKWDGILHKNDGVEDDNAYITTDITGAISFPLLTEGRSTARNDIFWNANASASEPKGKLWVLHSHASSPHLDVYTYNSSTENYAEDTTNSLISGIGHANENNPGCMGVSENGYVWAGVLNNSGLRIQRSTNDGSSWSNVYTLTSTPNLGLCDIVSWNDGTSERVAIIGSEDGNGSNQTLYFYHILQTDDPSNGSNWTSDNQTVPSGLDTDNHIHAIVHNNIIYFVIKTSAGSGAQPLIVLFRRTATGSWTTFEVYDHNDPAIPTRPQIAYDETNDEIYLAHVQDTGQTFQDGYFTKASVTDLNTWDTPTLIFQNGTNEYRDMYVPQSPVNFKSNILFLSDNDTDFKIWYNTANIESEVSGGIPPGLFQRQIHGLRR